MAARPAGRPGDQFRPDLHRAAAGQPHPDRRAGGRPLRPASPSASRRCRPRGGRRSSPQRGRRGRFSLDRESMVAGGRERRGSARAAARERRGQRPARCATRAPRSATRSRCRRGCAGGCGPSSEERMDRRLDRLQTLILSAQLADGTWLNARMVDAAAQSLARGAAARRLDPAHLSASSWRR